MIASTTFSSVVIPITYYGYVESYISVPFFIASSIVLASSTNA